MKNIVKIISVVTCSIVLLSGCGEEKLTNQSDETVTQNITETPSAEQSEPAEETYQFINPDGKTLETRINPPEGFSRTDEKTGSLGDFLRNYEMQPDGSPVLLYNGHESWNQNAHIAVFKLPIENVNLQQCADSIMRVYAEYYRSKGEDDRIAFHFTNGFLASYSKWKQGYRIAVNGNNVSWVKSAEPDDSDETFIKYLHTVFNYAGTASMATECRKIKLDDIRIGDVFLRAGSPGHVLMVVDTAQNSDGKTAFLLAQGYMPAQEFHVLKNHGDDPWYYEDDVDYSEQKKEYSIGSEILERPEY